MKIPKSYHSVPSFPEGLINFPEGVINFLHIEIFLGL